MGISARGTALAVMGPAILAGPLALAPTASAAAPAPAAQVTAAVAVARQPAGTHRVRCGGDARLWVTTLGAIASTWAMNAVAAASARGAVNRNIV